MKHGLAGISDFCRPDRGDCLVGQILGEAIALLRRLRRLRLRDPLVQRPIPLIGLRAANPSTYSTPLPSGHWLNGPIGSSPTPAARGTFPAPRCCRATNDAKSKGRDEAGKPTEPLPLRILGKGDPRVTGVVGVELAGVSHLTARAGQDRQAQPRGIAKLNPRGSRSGSGGWRAGRVAG
jgi:hypothetical protein